MKLRKESLGTWSHLNKYVGRLKGIRYEITETHEGFLYVMLKDIKKDINFNSLWYDIKFYSIESAKEWCESLPDIVELRKKSGLK